MNNSFIGCLTWHLLEDTFINVYGGEGDMQVSRSPVTVKEF